MYDVVSVKGQMVGGHYAVEGPDRRVIGAEFGLDKRRADILSSALVEAYRLGQMSISDWQEPFLRGSQRAREG